MSSDAEERGNTGTGLLNAEEVARRLGIKRETVYAYVSRGLLHSRRDDGSRVSQFDPLEVERLANRSRRAPSRSQAPLMFKSALTIIHRGEPHYRGRNVRELAVTHTFEETAHLLWLGDLSEGTDVFEPDPAMVATMVEVGNSVPNETLPVEWLRVLLPVAATVDPMRHDLQTHSIVRSARTILPSVIEALPDQGGSTDVRLRLRDRVVPPPILAERLWSRLCSTPPTESLLRALNAILVLTADHDLATPSTLTARVAASYHTDIYSVLVAALHTGGGPIQGASSLAIESYLNTLSERTNMNRALGERLRQGHDLPGFGHRGYPDGDLRAALVLEMVAGSDASTHRVTKLRELLELQRRRGLPPPNIGFAIAALAYVAGMIRGAGEVIFSVARMAGWIAHAIEEYESGHTVPRQHSVYIGRPPAGSTFED